MQKTTVAAKSRATVSLGPGLPAQLMQTQPCLHPSSGRDRPKYKDNLVANPSLSFQIHLLLPSPSHKNSSFSFMKLNIAIVALALSSSALTLAAPLPMPMLQSWGFLRKAVGKVSGKSSSAAQEVHVYADGYAPYTPKELSPETSPVHSSHSGGDSSRSAERDSRHGDESGYSTSSEASPVHRSHGGGDSSRPAGRDPRHGGDESGHWTSAHDDNYVRRVELSPHNHYQLPYLPHIPHQPQHNYVSPHGHVLPEGPPVEFFSQYSSHDAHRFPVGGYLNGPPSEQNRIGWPH
ncbi:hypothetical protein NDA18_001574 [Ustilago nuda]|nr:hypothetical protein NDA18_001574 [Ustilago nuda]